jgi:polysaccharide biosynthesis/export protein
MTSGLPTEETYALGPGDRVQISIYNVPELSGEARVSADGYLSLPWLGNVSVSQMSLTDARRLLIQQYSQFLTRPPVLTFTLLEARPVRVTVSGEVNRPGTYLPTVTPGDVNRPGTFTPESPSQLARSSFQWPTLTQALQQAGGITQRANIRQVIIRRPQWGGRNLVTRVDLWRLINAGSNAQDISLRDGDSIIVPVAEQADAAEALKVANANFAPRVMRVQVVGEVVRPGPVEVPTSSTLNQAILAAGGFDNQRAQKSEVEFVRLNVDGTVERRWIPVDLAAEPNESTNPMMRENDVIIAQRSRSTRTGDKLESVGKVITPISGVASILRLLLGK